MTTSPILSTPPDKWKEPRIFHAEFDKDYENRISVSNVELDKKILEENEREKNYSPNKAYWYLVNSPDTMKPGPWTAEIIVFNERDYFIEIKLIDYAATYKTTIEWINEKLLYIRFWLGRIAGIYFIFDIEKEKVIIKEMFWDGHQAFQQWQQGKQK